MFDAGGKLSVILAGERSIRDQDRKSLSILISLFAKENMSRRTKGELAADRSRSVTEMLKVSSSDCQPISNRKDVSNWSNSER
jgi:hypothetical protein